MKRNLLLVSLALLLLATAAQAADKNSAPQESADGMWSAGAAAPAAKGAGGALATTAVQPRSNRLNIPPAPVVPTVIPSEKKAPSKTFAARGESNIQNLGSGGPYAAKTVQAQRFVDYLDLKPEQSNSPLTLTIDNNGYSWFRILIANQVIATEKSLKGRASGTFDLTGLIEPGSNQVVLTGAGRPGATISWKVTTLSSASLDRVDPDEALIGETIRLKGKGFSNIPSKNEVTVEGKKMEVVAANPTELQVVVPKDAPLGTDAVLAKVNGTKAGGKKITVKVRGIPEVSGSNIQGVPPGQQVIIFGKNFSKVLSENQVLFGDTTAQVISGSDTSLTVIAPNVPWTVGHGPCAVTVKVGKAISKNSINVQIGPQMFADPTMNPGAPNGQVPMYVPGDNQ